MLDKIFLNNKVINYIIIVNTVITILLAFKHYNILFILDNIITLIFLVEVIYKVLVYKSKYFSNIFNVIDGVLVLLASIPLILYFCVDTNNLNYLLLFRIFRIFKFIRFGKFIPNFKLLLNNFSKALKASMSLIISGVILLIIISTILTGMFSHTYPEYFGNPFESAYTVFRMLSVEGWYEIPNHMSKTVSYSMSILIRSVFSFFVFFGGMLCMSFFTSLIVDEMVSDNNDELINKVDDVESKIKELIELNTKIMKKLK